MDVPHCDRQRCPPHNLAKRPCVNVWGEARSKCVPQAVEHKGTDSGEPESPLVLFLEGGVVNVTTFGRRRPDEALLGLACGLPKTRQDFLRAGFRHGGAIIGILPAGGQVTAP